MIGPEATYGRTTTYRNRNRAEEHHIIYYYAFFPFVVLVALGGFLAWGQVAHSNREEGSIAGHMNS